MLFSPVQSSDSTAAHQQQAEPDARPPDHAQFNGLVQRATHPSPSQTFVTCLVPSVLRSRAYSVYRETGPGSRATLFAL